MPTVMPWQHPLYVTIITFARGVHLQTMALFARPQSTAIKIVKPTVSEVGKQRLRKGTPRLSFMHTA